MGQIRSAIVSGVGEALEQIVLPRLVALETNVDILQTNVDTLKHVQSEQGEQLDRIERKLNATIDTTDHLEVRVKALETKFST